MVRVMGLVMGSVQVTEYAMEQVTQTPMDAVTVVLAPAMELGLAAVDVAGSRKKTKR